MSGAPKNIRSTVLQFITLFIGVILVAAAVYQQTVVNRESQLATTSTRQNCSFEALEKDFPHQDAFLWKALRSGIEHVLNDHPVRPAVFFIAHHNDAKSAHQIVQKVVDRTEVCMQNNDDPLKLNSSDFDNAEMNADYGVAIDKYHERLQKSGILLVTDANKIAANVAQAFHTICDTHSPFVKRSVIFLTMELDSNADGNDKSTLEIVEDQLKRNWNGLHMNLLQPLITRVTDQVLLLK